MVALPPKSNGDGAHDREQEQTRQADAHVDTDAAIAPDPVEVAEIKQFETNLRQALPHMDGEALSRVEEKLHHELDAAEKRWLWSWQNRGGHGGSRGSHLLNVLAAAAVVALVAGVSVVIFLAMTNGGPTPTPTPPKPPAPEQLVVDEFDVIIEQQVDPSAPPLFERPMIDLSAYPSLIGEQNVTQR